MSEAEDERLSAATAPQGAADSASARARVERRLSELDDRPTAQHAEVYEELHRDLQDALAAAQQPSART